MYFRFSLMKQNGVAKGAGLGVCLWLERRPAVKRSSAAAMALVVYLQLSLI